MGIVAEFVDEFHPSWPDYTEIKKVSKLLRKHCDTWKSRKAWVKNRENVENVTKMIRSSNADNELEVAETIMGCYPGMAFRHAWIEDWIFSVMERHDRA